MRLADIKPRLVAGRAGFKRDSIRKLAARRRRYYVKHRDRLIREAVGRNQRRAAQVRECKRKWRAENREIANLKQREYRRRNHPKVLETSRKWRAKNREHIREYERRYYHARKALQCHAG